MMIITIPKSSLFREKALIRLPGKHRKHRKPQTHQKPRTIGKIKSIKVSKHQKHKKHQKKSHCPRSAFSRTYVIVVSVSVIFVASVFLWSSWTCSSPRVQKNESRLKVTAPIQLKSSLRSRSKKTCLNPPSSGNHRQKQYPRKPLHPNRRCIKTDAPTLRRHQTAEPKSPRTKRSA